jgi:glutaryl-CoA dehydrogenase
MNSQKLKVFRGPFGIVWRVLGEAQDCMQTVRDYMLGRSQFGAPSAANQIPQKKLADMSTEITVGRQAGLSTG